MSEPSCWTSALKRLVLFGFLLTLVGQGAFSQNAAQSTLSPPETTRSSPADRSGNDSVTLNFLNTNLEDVVKGVSAITGKRFFLPNDLKSKTVNLVTPQPIAAPQVYDALLSMLRVHRLAAVENDGIVNIVSETEAWAQAPVASPIDPDSKLVSKVMKFTNITSTIAANIIRPFISQKGFPLVPNTNNNSLVVVDYASNIRNLETILRSLDQTENLLPVVFPVNHLSVLDADNALRNMLQSPPPGSAAGYTAPVSESIFADVPNNRLLIRADAKRLMYIAQLLAFIDVPRRSANLINIYPLKFTNAEQMAKTLQSLLVAKNSASSGTTLPKANNSAPSPAAGFPASTNTQIGGEVFDLSAGGVNIQADNATNSLIIAAPENLYRNIVDIVRKLDVRRKQVYVEVLIADINGSRINELGVQWLATKGLNSTDTSVIGGTNYDNPSIAQVAQNPLSTGQGLSIGVIRGTVNIPGVGTILNLGMLARALEQKLNGNILSSPNLLVLNNEESKLLVGTNVPVVTGQYTQSTGASSNPFQTIERKDVGVSLRIKPQIMDSGTIMLDLYQEVSDILSVSAQGPTTSKRTIESKILLDDGQIMVLGGLISEKQNNERYQVPFLGQIPLLGRLFSYDKVTHSKSNLVLFIRPVVLKTDAEIAALSAQKYQAIADQLPYEGEDLKGFFGDHKPILRPLAEFNTPLALPSQSPLEKKPTSLSPLMNQVPALIVPLPPEDQRSPFVPEPLTQSAPPPLPSSPTNIPDLAPPNLVIIPPQMIHATTSENAPPRQMTSTQKEIVPTVAFSPDTTPSHDALLAPDAVILPLEDADSAARRLEMLRQLYRGRNRASLELQRELDKAR
jgi:general secretion pathway protein D